MDQLAEFVSPRIISKEPPPELVSAHAEIPHLVTSDLTPPLWGKFSMAVSVVVVLCTCAFLCSQTGTGEGVLLRF